MSPLKFKIKKNILRNGYDILDENGDIVFKAVKSVLALRKTIKIYKENEQIFELKQKWLRMWPTYAITGILGDGTVARKMRMLCTERCYQFAGQSLQDFIIEEPGVKTWELSLKTSDDIIMKLQRKKMALIPNYILEIYDAKYLELSILAATIVRVITDTSLED